YSDHTQVRLPKRLEEPGPCLGRTARRMSNDQIGMRSNAWGVRVIHVDPTFAAQRIGRSAAWDRPPTIGEARPVDARTPPKPNWNGLCHSVAPCQATPPPKMEPASTQRMDGWGFESSSDLPLSQMETSCRTTASDGSA